MVGKLFPNSNLVIGLLPFVVSQLAIYLIQLMRLLLLEL